MKWIIIQRLHINADLVQTFHWMDGRLYLRFSGDDSVTFRDPDRKLYLHVCGCLGVLPVEGALDGEV